MQRSCGPVNDCHDWQQKSILPHTVLHQLPAMFKERTDQSVVSRKITIKLCLCDV